MNCELWPSREQEKCWAKIIGSFCSAFFLYLPHPTIPPPHFIIIIIMVQLRWWKKHNNILRSNTFSRWVGLLSKDHSGVHKKKTQRNMSGTKREIYYNEDIFFFKNGRKGYSDSLFSLHDLARPQRHSGHHFNVCMVRLALWENMKYVIFFIS